RSGRAHPGHRRAPGEATRAGRAQPGSGRRGWTGDARAPPRHDPLADPVDEVSAEAESVSMALLVVLESLSPLERAVFVLMEVFGYSHGEVAEMLDRSQESVRQAAHRAREHVRARGPGPESKRSCSAACALSSAPRPPIARWPSKMTNSCVAHSLLRSCPLPLACHDVAPNGFYFIDSNTGMR